MHDIVVGDKSSEEILSQTKELIATAYDKVTHRVVLKRHRQSPVISLENITPTTSGGDSTRFDIYGKKTMAEGLAAKVSPPDSIPIR